MENIFEDFEKRFSYLTDEEKELLMSVSEFKEYSANEILIDRGDITQKNYFIVKGIIRTFTSDKNGDEKTVFLASEGLNIGSENNFLFKKPASKIVMTVEDCIVIELDLNKLDELCLDHIGLMRFYRDCLKNNLKEAVQRIEFYTLIKPKDRYFKLLETNPELIQRVPQKHLASYLGMKPESLSRIKNQNSNKN